jgi:hypothetical protein
MNYTPDHVGECLCGAINIEVTGAPEWVSHCHCPSCQKATSSAFASYAGFKAEMVKVTGDSLKTYRSSPGVTRKFCGQCGSAVSFEGEAWPGQIHLHLVLLEDASNFKPQGHTYIKTKQSWLHLNDELPQAQTFNSDEI